MSANLIQAEFFLANIKTESLELLKRELHERRVAGARLKLVVRFYDQEGCLTNLVNQYAKCQEKREAILQSRSFGRGIKFGRNAAELLRLRDRGLSLAVKTFEKALYISSGAAIEDSSTAPLRLIEEGERHELIEAARKASAVWLFVFTPNDLLSDKNETLATLTL